MDLTGEVADIHTKTDAKNLVTSARTIHLPEQKDTIHMISMLRKEACSGSIHDLGHISTLNCLAYCLTKASAKADNLITAVKTVDLLEVDIHPNFRTLMEHKALLVYMVQNVYAHKREGCSFCECFEDFSHTNSTSRTISCDVCEKTTYSRTKEPKDYDWNLLM